MIVKPENMTFADKKIRMLIAGFPGIGKTTLALSAPKPLYIDVDLSAYKDKDYEIVGCDVCMRTADAWEVEDCFPERE